MPNFVRWREAGATYFFTVVTYDRREILTRPQSRSWLHAAIASVRAEMPFDVLAMVLLPDHLHCIWTLPEGDDKFPTRWRWIKTRFTQSFLAGGGCDRPVTAQSRRQGRRGIWQPRYWEHRIEDEDDYFRHRDYIHMNPVKHGLAARPQDWEWSSIHRHIRLGWLDPNWPGSTPPDLPDIEE